MLGALSCQTTWKLCFVLLPWWCQIMVSRPVCSFSLNYQWEWDGGSNFGVNQSKNSVVNLMHLWMTEVISRKGLISTLLFIYWQFVIQQTEGMYLIQIPFEDPLTYYLVLSKHTFFLYLFRTYCGGYPIFRRLWVLQEFGPEDGADVQTVLRAAVSARPLWLWNAGGQVCAGDGRFSETTKPWQIRGCGIDSST